MSQLASSSDRSTPPPISPLSPLAEEQPTMVVEDAERLMLPTLVLLC